MKKKLKYTPVASEEEARQRAIEAKAKGQLALNGALNTAVRFRDLLLAKALLSIGADPNYRDGNRETILGHAVAGKSAPMVQLVVDHGADVNLPTILNTPLLDAIYEEQWPIVELLLSAGADVNKTGFVTSSALHVATRFIRDVQFVKSLLERGAKVNTKDDEGRTPLEWAEENGDKAIVELLKAAGAKVQRKSPPSRKVIPRKKPGKEK